MSCRGYPCIVRYIHPFMPLLYMSAGAFGPYSPGRNQPRVPPRSEGTDISKQVGRCWPLRQYKSRRPQQWMRVCLPFEQRRNVQSHPRHREQACAGHLLLHARADPCGRHRGEPSIERIGATETLPATYRARADLPEPHWGMAFML